MFPSSPRCPGRAQGCLSPVADVPWLLLGSVSSVSPVLVPCCHWGLCFGVCNAGKEELQLLMPL